MISYYFSLSSQKFSIHMFKLIVLILMLPARLYANEPDSVATTPHNDIMEKLHNHTGKGEVHIHGDQSIHNLLKWHTRLNEQKKNFSGYRIQIYSANSFGCNIDELKEIRDKFEKNFQTIPAYLTYFNPDFKIRTGNYHSRLESIPDLYKIRKLYPTSYPVKMDIALEELKRIPMQDIIQAEEDDEFEDIEEVDYNKY